MGTSRVDVLGSKKGGWLSATEIVAVELKNDLAQMKRGLDQMTNYADYAHRVYLAITPFLAAAYLDSHSEGLQGPPLGCGCVLDRKLEQFGFGLLLVEGNSVYEHRQAKPRVPHAKKLQEVELALRGREPI